MPLTPRLRLVLLARPAPAFTLTIKIAVKVSGRRLLVLLRNQPVPWREVRIFNRKVVIRPKKDILKLQQARPLIGFMGPPIVCVEGTLLHFRSKEQMLMLSVNAATAALFGNKEDQQKNQDIHDQGKAAQRSVE